MLFQTLQLFLHQIQNKISIFLFAPVIKYLDELLFLALDLLWTLTHVLTTGIVCYLMLIHNVAVDGICERTQFFKFYCSKLECGIKLWLQFFQIVQNSDFAQPFSYCCYFILFTIQTEFCAIQLFKRPIRICIYFLLFLGNTFITQFSLVL